METGPWLKVSSDRLEKQRSNPRSLVYKPSGFFRYTTMAPKIPVIMRCVTKWLYYILIFDWCGFIRSACTVSIKMTICDYQLRNFIGHPTFPFSKLPPVEYLIVNLYREADRKKKKDRNTLIGTPSFIRILTEMHWWKFSGLILNLGF